MTLWTSKDAARATGGKTGSWEASGVSIDTRTLAPGDLFVALTAARDGHDFVVQALQAGAAAALVSRIPDGADPARCLLVPDVQAALEDLGRAARARSTAKIVAITGSVGKTSTKEMLRAALKGQGRIHAAEASYNNHWGVPLTLARMPQDTELGIFEIGMSNPGEIAPLSRQVRPHVAMITTVAAAHLAAFESLDGIAREKASIVEGLEPGGIAVLHGDLDQTPILTEAARKAGARIITFGERSSNHHRITDVHIALGHTTGKARGWRTPMLIKVASEGRHFAVNALGVMAVVRALGCDRARALCGLAEWRPATGRGQREDILLDPQENIGFELIDDAFNANPSSMTAALEVLAAAQTRDGVGRIGHGRRVAVLGDMLELGKDEKALHRAVADDPSMAHIDLVHCVGPLMAELHAALPEEKRGQCVPRAEDLAPHPRRLADAGDVVLVKGSKGSRVSLLVDMLRKLGQRKAPQDEDR
ncbi:MAG: UDP-N-acetylmuramoyl-tripeptide--D-alanyl-D-alanine ligase [Proteobacteria bacterium]|nr:MAG: UDP-N-acetylmuramoyl-tripeptide--D-alanyl-D-alanine ligase [Pseudomonadota bacterium]